MHGGYTSGASALGLPDVGLATMTETVASARRIGASVDIPVICDVNDGFGDLINVDRTAREVIGAGLAGLMIGDQAAPQRIPSTSHGRTVDSTVLETKVRVISTARAELDPSFVNLARTHTSRVSGVDEAIRRGRAYAAAGADLFMFDLATRKRRWKSSAWSARLYGRRFLSWNMSETVGRPLLDPEVLREMGFKIVIYPVTALLAAAGAVAAAMEELRLSGTTERVVSMFMSHSDVLQLTGLARVDEFESIWRNP